MLTITADIGYIMSIDQKLKTTEEGEIVNMHRKHGPIAWRARKGSLGDPIKILPCGCKTWVYTRQIVRYCAEHVPAIIEGQEVEK